MKISSFVRLLGLSCVTLVVLLASSNLFAQESARQDIVIADFEGDSYGDWKAAGDAFGEQPVAGTLEGQMDVSGFEGKSLVNSFRGGDRSTGTLTSPPIAVEY